MNILGISLVRIYAALSLVAKINRCSVALNSNQKGPFVLTLSDNVWPPSTFSQASPLVSESISVAGATNQQQKWMLTGPSIFLTSLTFLNPVNGLVWQYLQCENLWDLCTSVVFLFHIFALAMRFPVAIDSLKKCYESFSIFSQI